MDDATWKIAISVITLATGGFSAWLRLYVDRETSKNRERIMGDVEHRIKEASKETMSRELIETNFKSIGDKIDALRQAWERKEQAVSVSAAQLAEELSKYMRRDRHNDP